MTKAWIEVTCGTCGTVFQKRRCWAKRTPTHYCSTRCNGIERGKEWAAHGHKGRAGWTDASLASFREKMSGSKNPAWKGGVTYRSRKGNYVQVRYVRAPEWAWPMARKDGYVMEHRLVMAQIVGRLLTRTEVVHHRNHAPLDNRRGNLELWPDNRSHKLAEHGRCVSGVANRVYLTA